MSRNIVYSILFFILSIGVFPVNAAHAGNFSAPDPEKLNLASLGALVLDIEQGKELYASYEDVAVPIASITKLMTAMVVLDANQPMDEHISITINDNPSLKNVFSRVRVGSELTRKELLQLSLMSSENRAASTLAHHYPGGMTAFVARMNQRAKELGMAQTHYVEPTGLSELNVSTARDLSKLLLASQGYPLIKELSTASKDDAFFSKPRHVLSFYNTNPLVNKADWGIRLSKTGYIDEAGHCLVMLATINKRPVAIVLLDSFGKRTHIADANRVRRWLETGISDPVPKEAMRYKTQKINSLNLIPVSASASGI